MIDPTVARFIVTLLEDAITAGLAAPEIKTWAAQRHPELRRDALPELERSDAALERAEERVAGREQK